MKMKTKETLIKLGICAASALGVGLVTGIGYYIGYKHSYYVGYHDGNEKSYAAGEAQGFKTAYKLQANQVREMQAQSPTGQCTVGFNEYTGEIQYEAIK